MFKPGQSGNPAGKPKGTKDKKWQNIQAIWDMFIEEYPKLRSNEKARYMLEIFKLHFERAIAQLPKDQNDSINSANKLMEELKQLEAQFGQRDGTKSDTNSVADRTPKI